MLGRVSELPPASLRAPRLRASALARYLFGAYAVLVVYASLHPFSGWQVQAPTPFAFLTAPLPRSITRFDLVTNILGYIPLGFLAVLAAYPRPRAGKGLAFGIAGSFALTRVLRGILVDTSATDPAVFAGVSLLLSLVALAACYAPAKRAVRVEPVVALRYE